MAGTRCTFDSNNNLHAVWQQQEDGGSVQIACTDFAWIARRHAITDRDAAFAMATKVVASIVSAAGATPA